MRGNQLGWEYIKFEIRQFSITFSKNLSKCVNADRELLEKKLKDLEKSGSFYSDNEDYKACQTKLDNIYDKKVEGIRIRRRCDWSQKGEKSTKFFLSFEKRREI